MRHTDPVTVVGAGWAGLSAAFHVARAGRQVTLIEAAPQAGGRARGLTLNLLGHERELDNGQHLLIGAYTETRALVRAAHICTGTTASPVSISPFRLRQAQGLDFARMAAADRIPLLRLIPQLGTGLGLLSARGLSITDKLAFVRLSSHLKTAHFRGFDGQSVATLLSACRQPGNLVDQVWEPLCVSALNTGVAQACAQTFVNVLHDSLMTDPDAPEDGSPPVWPSDYLVPEKSLSAYFVNPVLGAIRHLGGQVMFRRTIRELDELGPGPVVLAVPPVNAAALLEPRHPELARKLRAFDYQSITTVYLAWDEDLSAGSPAFPGRELPTPLLLREEPTHQAWGQWLFDRGFEKGIHVAAVVVSARGRYASLSTDELSARIAAQVHRQTGLPLPKAWKAITEKRATYTCSPERPVMKANNLALRPPDGQVGGVFLAGDYCYPPYPATLESAVRSGLAAAQRIHA